MENPEAMINQYLRDMEIDIHNAESALIKQMAFQKRIEKELGESIKLIDLRTQQAESALKAGDEGLARRAIADKQEHEKNREVLQMQYDQATVQVNSFRSQLGELKQQFQSLSRQRQQLIARHGYAKALTKMQKTMSKTTSGSAVANFERMANRVSDMEAEANARLELSRMTPDIDADFRKLNATAEVDRELDLLKAKLAQ